MLGNHLIEFIPQNSRVLDVGCGDGLLARFIKDARIDLDIRGIDVLARDQIHIPIDIFNGDVIPYDDRSFDVVIFVDVLHHTEDPMVLLREAARVSRKEIIIKDHTRDGLLAGPTLRFMDWVGNDRYGVALPYNYWPEKRWLEAFRVLGLEIGVWKRKLGLYPRPASWVFGRSLHFITRLEKNK